MPLAVLNIPHESGRPHKEYISNLNGFLKLFKVIYNPLIASYHYMSGRPMFVLHEVLQTLTSKQIQTHIKNIYAGLNEVLKSKTITDSAI